MLQEADRILLGRPGQGARSVPANCQARSADRAYGNPLRGLIHHAADVLDIAIVMPDDYSAGADMFEGVLRISLDIVAVMTAVDEDHVERRMKSLPVDFGRVAQHLPDPALIKRTLILNSDPIPVS